MHQNNRERARDGGGVWALEQGSGFDQKEQGVAPVLTAGNTPLPDNKALFNENELCDCSQGRLWFG